MKQTENIPPDYDRAFEHALKLLGIRKRTVRQLSHKLSEKGFDPIAVSEVLSRLQENKLLDDEEFARAYVSEKTAIHPAGKLKMLRDLKRKGVSQEAAGRAVSELDENYEFNMAFKLGQGKAQLLSHLDPRKRKKKVYDYLMRKGFHSEVCLEVIKGIR